jgi:hypothetical protein
MVMIASFLKRSAWTGILVPALLSVPKSAEACGGFFCSSATLPINQAAERIVFADNGNGTVTAVIQIMYQGPAQNFSWLLPISSVPMQGETIGVASNAAFQRLQQATNPQYSLTTQVEGTCANDSRSLPGTSTGAGGSTASGGGISVGPTKDGVSVEASGTVGAFDWTAISLDPTLTDPAQAATTWLHSNGYLVSEGAPGLLRPYLESGLYLLALKLTKGADTGSIRPLVLTYSASKPMIPIKLTAVAANDDMGVMTWLLSSARGVPQNYLGLELNEARINWFNASSNYNDVVTAAANEAGGRGFVTEFAGPSTSLSQTVWQASDEAQWQGFRSTVYPSFDQLFQTSYNMYGTLDGFWDAVQATVMLPAEVAFGDFKLCPSCYSDKVVFSPSAYVDALDKNVIQPMKTVQNLIDAHPYVTRLYTTMSAAEMTDDPLFTFNPDLPAVNNLHTATRFIECKPSVNQFDAPWRIELPQGGVIRGTATQVGVWPGEFASQPSNHRIVQLAAAGSGAVLEDNDGRIVASLDSYNASLGAAGGMTASSGCSVGLASSPNRLGALAAVAALALLRRRRATGARSFGATVGSQ